VQRVEKSAAPLIGLSRANLSDANLLIARLSDANLFGTNLRDANLRDADLSTADLSYADLRDADLTAADGVSKEMIEQQTKLLSNTTMPDGTVIFGEFEPPLSLNPGGSLDWYILSEAKTPDSISISGPESGLLLFTNSLQVFDPSNPSEPKEFSEPENAKEWVAWFQRQPNLDTSKPLPVRVDGASGKQIDVKVPSTPENYPQEICYGQPCVPRYRLSEENGNENGIAGYEGFKDRFVIVDIGGETVLIDAAAPTDKFDEFLPKAQKVLDSVEWKGG
jgi:hypothetical protein